jgi:hypothetical protein
MSLAMANPATSGPWWKFGHVWMVVAGPLLVVLASFVTLYLAISRPDPVMDDDYYRRGIELNKSADQARPELAPAVAARNHAATGTVPVKK